MMKSVVCWFAFLFIYQCYFLLGLFACLLLLLVFPIFFSFLMFGTCFLLLLIVCLFVAHILPILASRTVDDGEASADEVVLHVHYDER